MTLAARLPTRMEAMAKGLPDPGTFRPEDADQMNPQHVANIVSYLASEQASWLSGQVFEITDTNVRRWVPWSPTAEIDSAAQWTPDALDAAMATMVYGTLPSGRVIPTRH
jgi:hypothetical protein